MRLAKATNSTVLTTKEEVKTDQMQSADLTYVSPSGQETPLTDEQLVDAAANTPPVGTSGQSASTSSADNAAMNRAPAQQGNVARARLPKTATPIAGIGLLGLFSLLGSAWVRFRA
jgi:hypothetical protein